MENMKTLRHKYKDHIQECILNSSVLDSTQQIQFLRVLQNSIYKPDFNKEYTFLLKQGVRINKYRNETIYTIETFTIIRETDHFFWIKRSKEAKEERIGKDRILYIFYR